MTDRLSHANAGRLLRIAVFGDVGLRFLDPFKLDDRKPGPGK